MVANRRSFDYLLYLSEVCGILVMLEFVMDQTSVCGQMKATII